MQLGIEDKTIAQLPSIEEPIDKSAMNEKKEGKKMSSGKFDLSAALAVTEKSFLPSDAPFLFDEMGIPDVDITTGIDHSVAFMILHEDRDIPDDTVIDAAELGKIKTEEMKELMRRLGERIDTYRLWYLMLVTCQQVKPMTSDNIENFLESQKAARVGAPKLLQVIDYCSRTSENLAGNKEIIKKFESEKFFEYHTTATSSPALVRKAYDFCPIRSNLVFTDEEIRIVDEGLQDKWDSTKSRLIPQSTLVRARAVLDAIEALPRTWYMGQRAYEDSSPKRYNSMVKLMKAAAKVSSEIELPDDVGIEQIESMFQDQGFLE